MEQSYIDEYQLILETDKEHGKDFNKLAYHDLKKAHYFFEYLRTSEKQYHYEQNEKENHAEQKKLPQKTKDVALTEAETSLLEGPAQSKANIVLEAAKPKEGKRYAKFKEEFSDLFEL